MVESFPSSHLVSNTQIVNSRSEDNSLFELIAPGGMGEFLVVLEDLCLSFHLSVFFSHLKEYNTLVAPCELDAVCGDGFE